MSHSPTHRIWCDRRHVEVGSPVCSAEVGGVEVVTVMLFANGDEGTDVAIVGADGTSLLAWPGHLMLRLVRTLEEAVQISLGTWPPLLNDAGPAVDPWQYTTRLVDEAEREVRRMIPVDQADRASAAAALQSWKRYGEMSAREVTMVLDRFGPKPGETR